MSIFASKGHYRAVVVANDFSPVDFYLVHQRSSKVEAFAEVKARNGKADTYEKMISLVKYVEIRSYVVSTGLPCYIIFGYPEDQYRIVYIQVTPISELPRVEWSGRKDREDPADREAVVIFSKGQEIELKWKAESTTNNQQ